MYNGLPTLLIFLPTLAVVVQLNSQFYDATTAYMRMRQAIIQAELSALHGVPLQRWARKNQCLGG